MEKLKLHINRRLPLLCLCPSYCGKAEAAHQHKTNTLLTANNDVVSNKHITTTRRTPFSHKRMVIFSNATKKYYQCSRRPLTSTTSSFIRRRTAARLFTFIATLFIIFSSAKNYQSALSMNQKNRKATFFNQRLKLKRNILLRFPKDLIIFMNIFESVFLCTHNR